MAVKCCDASEPITIRNTTTPSKANGVVGPIEVDRRGCTFVDGTVRHWRGIVMPAKGAYAVAGNCQALSEGPCDFIRTNTEGLVVYAQPTERPFIVVGGASVTSTNFTLGAGWANILGGGVRHTAGGGTNTVSQDTAVSNPNDPLMARIYLVVYRIANRTAGTVTASLGTTAGTANSSNGWYYELITCAANSTFAITPTDAFDGDLLEAYAVPSTLPLSANVWESFGCCRVLGCAASDTSTTLISTPLVNLGWYRKPSSPEIP